MSVVSSMGRICPEVLEKKILNFVNAFLLFCIYFLFEKGLDLHKKNYIRCIVPSLVENILMILEKKTLIFFNHVFFLFCNYLHFEKRATLHLYKLESPSVKNALCQVWLKLDQWFRKRVLKVFNVFLLFHNNLPFEKGVVHHLHKHESPSPKYAMCQVWLKFAQWFWRRWKCEKFTDGRTDWQTDDRWSEKLLWAFSSGELKTHHFLLHYFLKPGIPFTHGCFVPSLVEIGPTVAVAQWVRAFASQAEGLVFESKPRLTWVVKKVVTTPLQNARQ